MPLMPFDRIIDASGMLVRWRNHRRRMWVTRLSTMLLAVVAIISIGFPLVAQYRTSRDLAEVASRSETVVAGWSKQQVDGQLQAARAYNRRLASSQRDVLETVGDYDSLLDTGNGVMGSIRIPKISVDLPIYHGTSETALLSGIGHLQGTSLPVGGKSTHAVLTGHRGLIKAAMFTRLDEMRVGDTFDIDVLDESLLYRVDRISVIDPDDTSQLTVQSGEERVTLMTCTPYGVNTHRLLVSGIRVSDAGSSNSSALLLDPQNAAAVAICTAIAVGCLAIRVFRIVSGGPRAVGAFRTRHSVS